MPTAEERAPKTTQALTAIVETSDDAIVGKTLGGIITSWNPAAERLDGGRDCGPFGHQHHPT